MKYIIVIAISSLVTAILAATIFLANFTGETHVDCGYTSWIRKNERWAVCRNPNCEEDTKARNFIRELNKEGEKYLLKIKKERKSK